MRSSANRWSIGWSLACLVAVCWMWSGAAEGQEKIKGQRVFYTGHSFHMFVVPKVEQLVKSAGISDHKLLGSQSIGGSRVHQHWDLPAEKNNAKKALATGQVDVFTMAPHLEIPDRGIDSFFELALKHNPNTRLMIQASWAPWDSIAGGQRIFRNDQRDQTNLAALQSGIDTWRKQMEAQTDALNEKAGKKVVYIVPVGDAVMKLRKMVVDGKFPGVRRQSALFSDTIGHGLAHVQALTAYCNFCAIYGCTVEGLSLKENGVTDEQHAILQRIAWETVSQYPYAGVKKPEAAAVGN